MGGEFEQSTVCGIDVQVHVSYAGRYTVGAGLCVRACVRALKLPTALSFSISSTILVKCGERGGEALVPLLPLDSAVSTCCFTVISFSNASLKKSRAASSPMYAGTVRMHLRYSESVADIAATELFRTKKRGAIKKEQKET